MSFIAFIIITHMILCTSRDQRAHGETLSKQNIITYTQITLISGFFGTLTLWLWKDYQYLLTISTMSMSIILIVEAVEVYVRYRAIYNGGRVQHTRNMNKYIHKIVIHPLFWIFAIVCKYVFFLDCLKCIV